jgi:hypothetical protein
MVPGVAQIEVATFLVRRKPAAGIERRNFETWADKFKLTGTLARFAER